MEIKNDIPTREDRDFIVDDGYKHDEDPTNEPIYRFFFFR